MVQFHIFHWRECMGTDNLFQKKKLERTRKKKKKPVLPYILIVCEGKKTEPNYFESYKNICKQEINIQIYGEGKNTTSLVKASINIRNKIQRDDKIKFDQVWCVFDKDDFKDDIYNGAFELCRNSNILPAYSNESFEIWYLLHFNFYNTGMKRDDAFDKLDKILQERYGKRYEKNMKGMYELIEVYQGEAIKRANMLEKMCEREHELHHQNPSTSVHKLIIELNKYKK